MKYTTTDGNKGFFSVCIIQTVAAMQCGTYDTAGDSESSTIRLTLLSPEIIHAIIAGTLEKDISIEQLKQAMPLMWDDQKKMFAME